MKKDLEMFCKLCNICQKIKNRNFTKFGYLTPNPIPTRPYESIPLDLIVSLPKSEGFIAILIVVNRLLKHAQFMAMINQLNTEGFADLFVM